MSHWEFIKQDALREFKNARKSWDYYELFYQGLSSQAKEYLQSQSREYKQYLNELQAIVLPVVSETCPVCATQCCHLVTPELSIWVAGLVGCFRMVDYLLARCDTEFPVPKLENAESNLCPFWDQGCVLPIDSRSWLCIQFFCDPLKTRLDMQKVDPLLEKINAIIINFSLQKCMV